MSDVNIINDIKINKSSTNLSKNAINFLSKQLVRDGDKIILKEKFILICKVEQKLFNQKNIVIIE